MRHLKCFLWLFAWSVWLWLGFGLYREMPRELGKPVCHLPLGNRTSLAGFLGDTNRFILIDASRDRQDAQIKLFDAGTGSVIGETTWPTGGEYVFHHFDGGRHNILLMRGRTAPDGLSERGLFLLDLTTWQWRRVSKWEPLALSVHPTRPWIAFATRTPEGRVGRPMVIDFETGSEVFSRELPPRTVNHSTPFFVGEERLVIPVVNMAFNPARPPFKIGPGGKRTMRSFQEVNLEVWNLAASPKLEKTIEDAPYERGVIDARHGRFAFPMSYNPDIGVFDAVEGRILFTVPDEPNIKRRSVLSPPVLSSSGRAVYGGDPTTLWDVDAGVILWRAREHESPSQAQSPTHFRAKEAWQKLWERWLPKWKYETNAYRSLETGEFLYRIPFRGDWPLTRWNADGTLAVAYDGHVYRTPPPADWPLLVFCQTILALPLILLWAILRWRRRRAARRQPALALPTAVTP